MPTRIDRQIETFRRTRQSRAGSIVVTWVRVGGQYEVTFIVTRGKNPQDDPWPLAQVWVIETERGGSYRRGHWRILRNGPKRDGIVREAINILEQGQGDA